MYTFNGSIAIALFPFDQLILQLDFILSCLFEICFQTSSQVAKLENTVETLRTVLTQKIQSEAQTVSACVLLSKERVLFIGINSAG